MLFKAKRLANHTTRFHCKETVSQRNEKARHYTAADWLKPEKWQSLLFNCTYLACLQNIYPQYILILEHIETAGLSQNEVCTSSMLLKISTVTKSTLINFDSEMT